MTTPRYVQHISGQGTRWQVKEGAIEDDCDVWFIEGKGRAYNLWLPKSEYALCDPPERWVNVTADVVVEHRLEFSELVHNGQVVKVRDGSYRLRKVDVCYPVERTHRSTCAFIVEKVETP